MTGMVEDFTVAVDVDGQASPFSVLIDLQKAGRTTIWMPGEEHRDHV
jgi:hypothetical protein